MTFTYDPYEKRFNSKDHKERIWRAIRAFNNQFLSDETHIKATEVLEEEFRDFIDQERYEYGAEKGWTDEEIAERIGSSDYVQFSNDEIVYQLLGG